MLPPVPSPVTEEEESLKGHRALLCYSLAQGHCPSHLARLGGLISCNAAEIVQHRVCAPTSKRCPGQRRVPGPPLLLDHKAARCLLDDNFAIPFHFNVLVLNSPFSNSGIKNKLPFLIGKALPSFTVFPPQHWVLQ